MANVDGTGAVPNDHDARFVACLPEPPDFLDERCATVRVACALERVGGVLLHAFPQSSTDEVAHKFARDFFNDSCVNSVIAVFDEAPQHASENSYSHGNQ